MASSEVLSQTLYSITTIKLDQLSQQKDAYQHAKQQLLARVDAAPADDPVARAKLLVNGARSLPAMKSLASKSAPLSLENIDRFLTQAQHDPSVSPAAVDAYQHAVRTQLDVQSQRYRFAQLYGTLVNQWIQSGSAASNATDIDASFVPLARAEMHNQRAAWEEYVFEPKLTQTDDIKQYLADLFTPGEGSSATSAADPNPNLIPADAPAGASSPAEVHFAFKKARESLKAYQKKWDTRTHFNDYTLGSCIRALLRSDLLNDQKRSTLTDFLENRAVLREIADVLNMRMGTRAAWQWSEPWTIEQRRSLNGRYRFFPDEDLLQTIFLFYIGRAWGVELRSVCSAFLHANGVMKPATPQLTRRQAKRRKHYLGDDADSAAANGSSLHARLERHFDEDVLLSQLPTSMDETRAGYDDDSDSGDDTRKSPVETVQELLRILQSVILLERSLGNHTAVVRSDFKWFGPSLPHSSIFAVLEFLGVERGWLDFFKRALECPLRFEDDPPNAAGRLRRRGIPLSTPLADFLSESVLFVLDFAVNQRADGTRLYRLHDDMWLFDSPQRCAAAWDVIVDFTRLFGLQINEDKTGSAVLSPSGEGAVGGGGTGSSTRSPSLPSGPVSWGFLALDASTGLFTLQDDKVTQHIAELRLQLRACRSIFDWIQAWNTYGVRFFSTNFGTFANCFTRAHVDAVLAAFRRVQVELFPNGGGVAGELKRLLREQFDVTDVPDGYLFYPVELGGLGLLNPFLPALGCREEVVEDASEVLQELRDREGREYARARADFESGELGGSGGRRRNPPKPMMFARGGGAAMRKGGGPLALASAAPAPAPARAMALFSAAAADPVPPPPGSGDGEEDDSPAFEVSADDDVEGGGESEAAGSRGDAAAAAAGGLTASATSPSPAATKQEPENDGDDTFLSFREYVCNRHRTSPALLDGFEKLLRLPSPSPLNVPPSLAEELDRLFPPPPPSVCHSIYGRGGGGGGGGGGAAAKIMAMRWTVVQHSNEMVARFGGVTVVEPGLLPMGLLEMLRKSRVKWMA